LEVCLPVRFARLGVESPCKRWSSWPYCSMVRPAMGDWSVVGSLIEVVVEGNSRVDRVFRFFVESERIGILQCVG
jgi:hypothetical protein